MTEESRDHQIRKFLAAFADGELDIEQTIEILSRLSMNPATAARVEHQQRLREAVSRVMQSPDCRGHSARCPEMLRKEIERVMVDDALDAPASSPSPDTNALADASEPRPPRSGVLAKISRWAPLAAAAVLLLAALGLYLDRDTRWADGLRPGTQASSILPASMARQMGQRHGVCSADTTELFQHALFPEAVRELPAAVTRQLDASGDDVIPLDLSVLGYRYVRAGECNVPGEPAAHIVYHADAASSQRDGGNEPPAMSLWITPDRGQFDALSDGRVFMARIAETRHPVMLWKRGGLVYLLLGEVLSDVESAANMLWARGMGDPSAPTGQASDPAKANAIRAG